MVTRALLIALIILAAGIGAQAVVKDVINGFFILFENQFGVGDVIAVDGAQGVVEAMNLRTTTLRDVLGRAHIIPNSVMQKVTVHSREWSRAVLDIEVASCNMSAPRCFCRCFLWRCCYNFVLFRDSITGRL
ncbi:MAG: mechanosensitive ion channel [Acidobacteria bacterium]|nr:mechanosensitive ion channel [Acidobacteriota bacterium]